MDNFAQAFKRRGRVERHARLAASRPNALQSPEKVGAGFHVNGDPVHTTCHEGGYQFLGLTTTDCNGIFPGMARKLPVEYPGAIYHSLSLEVTAGQV